MGIGTFSGMVDNRLQQSGQESTSSKSGDVIKNVYAAKVISTEDPFEQNRIIVEIINVDKDGKETPGEDRLIPKNKLPFCIPMIPNHIHIRPLNGEMVLIVCENPKDLTSTRFWMGPIINSKLKLGGQSYLEANSIFEKTEFNPNTKLNNKADALSVMPQQGDVALQGRRDADLILKPREALLIAGKFENKTDSYTLNTKTPLFLQLKQFDVSEKNPFSQANLHATNVNLYSPNGKFRNVEIGKKYEPSNKDLEYLGELANSLHPSVFGDELVKLLDLIIKILLTHIHTPQKSAVPNALTKELSEYTIEGKLQDILSKLIRIN